VSWPMVPLHDICRPKQWPTIASSKLMDHGFPVYGANGKIGFYDKYTHECPTVLITCRGATCGTINVCEPRSYVNGNAMALDQLDAQVDLAFLARYLRKVGLGNAISGSAQPQITREGLKAIQVPVPPLPEQRRIAAILDKAEDLRAKRREAVVQREALTQALFFDTFGDPVTNPKNLKVDSLGEYLTFVTSGGRGWAQYYAPSGSRFIRSLDVRMNFISDSDKAFIVAPENAEARRTKVQAGDVLLTITGSRIGRVAPVPDDFGNGYISQHVAILRVKKQCVDPRFLSFYLSLEAGGQRQIASAQYGQTKPGLNFEQIRRFEIPVRSVLLQEEFARRVAKSEQLSVAHERSAAELDALFVSLQHRAFRGEL
jgi:type I restriction enzyme, S subunit